MSGRKRNLFNAIFLATIFILTIYSVFRGQDLDDIAQTISSADPIYLVLGIVCVIFFIWGESVIIHYMLGTLKIKSKRRTCFMYSCVGFFFSCITPSASGGQPAQIYYMHKKDIPIPVATLVLMIVTITYKSILVFIGLYLVIFQQGFVSKYLTEVLPVFYLGLVLNICCCIFMLLLVFHTSMAKSIVMWGLGVLVALHIMKDKESRTQRLEASMDSYGDTAAFLKQHLKVLVDVALITFCQRVSLFFVTYFVYRSFGLHGTGMYQIIMLQAVISISVEMLPFPGGMGISEHLFLTIFAPIFYGDFLLPGMVLSRGIAYYVQLLFSAFVTMGAHFMMARPTLERKSTL